MSYAESVASGSIVACKWVRLACQRHLDDLVRGQERGLRFDEAAAAHAIDFFQFCRHSKGEWAGQTVTLEPWQQFIVWNVFGWMRPDDESGELVRRFKTAWVEVARKNGKSTFASGIGLYMLDADGEPGAEVYSGATKKDQAKITFDESTRMVKASPSLRKRIRPFRNNLHIPNTACKYEPLGRDTDSMDGLNTHCAIIDEVHAHKSREMWDLLDTSTGSRRQPLLLGITTAGTGSQTLWGNQHEYAEKVLEGIIQDDRFFAIIYTLDPPPKRDEHGNIVEPGDDWDDERCWIKANPNLGVSKKLSDLRDKALKAKEMPASFDSFLRRELNVSTSAVSRWINLQQWEKCGSPVNSDGLLGRTCYMGLDLSSTTDITACILAFPPTCDGDPYQTVMRFYLPRENMHQRVKRDRVPYDVWVRQGFITATPGNVIDYDFILADVDELMTRYDVAEVAYDPWGATQIQTKLAEMRSDNEDWLVQFRQGFASMSPAMKALERLYMAGQLAHGNNPVLNWMASNLVVRIDPAENVKPDKAKSTERIDGMVALAMAIDRAVRRQGAEPSVYEERGIRVL